MADQPMSAVATATALILDEIGRHATSDAGRLGSERDLAQQTGLSRWTIRQALKELEDQGLVRRVVGRNGGTFVGPASVVHSSGDMSGLPNELTRQGFLAGSRVIIAVTVAADPVSARNLNLVAGAFVYSITRIRLADGVPLSIENAQLPLELFPDLFDHPLSGSIYLLLAEHYSISAGRVDESIETMAANEEHASYLDIAVGEPLLTVTRTSHTVDGVPYEYSHDVFRGDRTRIVVSSAAMNNVELKSEQHPSRMK